MPPVSRLVFHGVCLRFGWLAIFSRSIDRGVTCRGRPLFGANKTWLRHRLRTAVCLPCHSAAGIRRSLASRRRTARRGHAPPQCCVNFQTVSQADSLSHQALACAGLVVPCLCWHRPRGRQQHRRPSRHEAFCTEGCLTAFGTANRRCWPPQTAAITLELSTKPPPSAAGRWQCQQGTPQKTCLLQGQCRSHVHLSAPSTGGDHNASLGRRFVVAHGCHPGLAVQAPTYRAVDGAPSALRNEGRSRGRLIAAVS